ncbi:hypothetical protein KAS45_04225, partial [candidate division WOR-3 bacterium]|nr:hypothetical protein [candidate division WOR-3 bacterium]
MDYLRSAISLSHPSPFEFTVLPFHCDTHYVRIAYRLFPLTAPEKMRDAQFYSLIIMLLFLSRTIANKFTTNYPLCLPYRANSLPLLN